MNAWAERYVVGSGLDLMTAAPEARWQPLLTALEGLGREELGRRRDEIQRLLFENGVTHGPLTEDAESGRPWQIDPLPLMMAPAQWRELEKGLVQRSRLMKALLADLYGPRRMLNQAVLPADALFANPAFWLPCAPLVGDEESALTLHGVDLTLDADGRWRVLADHLQTPAGMGYALENRIVMARVLPDIYRDAPLKRLAPFLGRRHESLSALSKLNLDHPVIALLAPGHARDGHFEHAYLAHYLNLVLVEGSDLVVRDNRLWMRTLGGLEPIDVLTRRIGDAWCDPLELRGDSLIGVPGLLQAIRAGGVSVTNLPGVGALEHPLIAAHLPILCERLLGESLMIDGVERHWCGSEAGREWALDDFDALHFQRLDGDTAEPRPSALDEAQARALRRAVEAEPERFVASRPVAGATAPFVGADSASLHPAPFNMRCFSQALFDDQAQFSHHEVMPGGLAWRGAPGTALQASQCVRDVWVTAETPQPHVSRLRRSRQPLVVTRDGDDLPSRVADSLFWLGRYGERLDGRTRLLREGFYRLMEQDQEAFRDESLAELLKLLEGEDAATAAGVAPVGSDQQRLLALLREGPEDALPTLVHRMISNGRAVRDYLGDDAWWVFNRMRQEATGLARLDVAGARRATETMVSRLAAFFGLCNETMPHHYGWRFMDIGRFIERTLTTLGLLRFALVDACLVRDPLCEIMLASTDNATAYRRRYRSALHPAAILDLLLFDEGNPRSVGYMCKRLARQIEHLPQPGNTPYRSEETQLLIRARSTLHLADLATLVRVDEDDGARAALAALLDALLTPIAALPRAIELNHFSHAEPPRQLIPMQAP